jgi:hypothetical protein
MRSAINRVAAMRADQEQLQCEVEKLRTQTHAILVLSVYTVALVAIVGLSVYSLSKAVRS